MSATWAVGLAVVAMLSLAACGRSPIVVFGEPSGATTTGDDTTSTTRSDDDSTTGPADACHPSYIPCLPIVDDLDCPDVVALGAAPVMVIGPDDYRLDADHDGIGCEQ